MNDGPHFRFYPNAYAEGGPFRRSDEVCDLCEREAGWIYTGEIYADAEPPTVCARCIADGSLRRRLPADGFVLQDIIIEEADAALSEEVLYATPNVASINPFQWPVIDGTPLAYLGVGDELAFNRDAEVLKAIAAAFADFGEEPGHPSHALIFKRIDADEYVAVIDLD